MRAQQTSQPPADATLLGWLQELSELEAPREFDRSILDTLHQGLPRDQRSWSGLVLAVSLPCMVMAVLANVQPRGTAWEAEQTQRAARPEPVPTPVERRVVSPADSAPQSVSGLQLAVVQDKRAKIDTADFATPVHRTRLARTNSTGIGRSASRPSSLALEPPVSKVPRFEIAAAELPAVQPRPAVLLAAETSLVVPTSRPPDPLEAMLNPSGRVASLTRVSDNQHRPLYKRGWFWGVVGVAATGIAAGVTAAVLTSRQSSHDLASAPHPLSLHLGPS